MLIGGETSLWFLWSVLLMLGFGAVLNSINVMLLLRQKRINGLRTVLLQLCVMDVLSVPIAWMEIRALQSPQAWPFATEWCQVYAGSETLINTVTPYLLLCLIVHAVELCNLLMEGLQTQGQPLITGPDTDSDDMCMVLSKRERNLGHAQQQRCSVTTTPLRRQHAKTIIVPVILIWFVGLSLSIPNYSLAVVLHSTEWLAYNATTAITQNICTVLVHTSLVHILVILFKLVIPVGLLLMFAVVVLHKLCTLCSTRIWPTDSADDSDLSACRSMCALMVLMLVLCAIYVLTSTQRVMHDIGVDGFRTPSLLIHSSIVSRNTMIMLTVLHYVGGTVTRGIILFAALVCFHRKRPQIFFSGRSTNNRYI